MFIWRFQHDNRANITDLKAHWDHTLGYLIGAKKFILSKNNKYFFAFEYLNLFKSNTEKFYRGYGDGFYGYDIYNYSSYESRRIGAHSGSSSDDFFFIIN